MLVSCTNFGHIFPFTLSFFNTVSRLKKKIFVKISTIHLLKLASSAKMSEINIVTSIVPYCFRSPCGQMLILYYIESRRMLKYDNIFSTLALKRSQQATRPSLFKSFIALLKNVLNGLKNVLFVFSFYLQIRIFIFFFFLQIRICIFFLSKVVAYCPALCPVRK